MYAVLNNQTAANNLEYNFEQILSTFKFLDGSQTVDTSDWKTYRNDEYKFEFKYPPSLVLKQNEPNEYVKYFNFELANENKTGLYPTYFFINVSVQTLPANTDLLTYIKSEQYFNMGGNQVKIFDEIKPYTTGKINGYYFFGGVEYMSWNVYFEKDGKIYSFSFSESEAGRYPEPEKKEPNILDQILSTFKFTN